MTKKQLKQLIREVIGVHSHNQPVQITPHGMRLSNGVYIPLKTHTSHTPSRPATPTEEAFGYAAMIVVGAALLAMVAPRSWGFLKKKYNQFREDLKNKTLGQTVSVEELAKDIEDAASRLSPITRKTVQRMLADAKTAKTPTEFGAQITKIRNHIQRYRTKNGESSNQTTV